MNRSAHIQSGTWRSEWIGVALALPLAVGCGVLLTQLLLQPSAGDLRSLAAYLTLSGAATIVAGWIVIKTIDRRVGLGIRTKSLFAALTGTAVALLNVLIVAQLMFVSTSHDLRLLLALIVFSSVVTVFFTVVLASTMVSRLESMASVIRALAGGKYSERASVSGGDEVTMLTLDINSLAARLESAEADRATLDAQRRELTASISHDLRTPLAGLRAMVEALDDEIVIDRAEVRRYYATMRREIERLSRMIDDLFELSRIDSGALHLDKQVIALDEIAMEVVDAMRVQAQRAGVAIEFSASPDLPQLMLDGSRIERAIANLIRNAVEHTPRQGDVRVSVIGNTSEVVLQVSDTGEGIPARDLPLIWTRFYRADKSRTKHDPASDGAGLGLAIARGIVEAHGGAIEAASTVGVGTTMTVRLPRGTADADGSRRAETAPVAP